MTRRRLATLLTGIKPPRPFSAGLVGVSFAAAAPNLAVGAAAHQRGLGTIATEHGSARRLPHARCVSRGTGALVRPAAAFPRCRCAYLGLPASRAGHATGGLRLYRRRYRHARLAQLAELAYQFGHELGHVLCNSWRPGLAAKGTPASGLPARRHLSRRSRCAVSAWLADSWTRDPVAGDAAYGAAIHHYRDNQVEKYRCVAAPQQTIFRPGFAPIAKAALDRQTGPQSGFPRAPQSPSSAPTNATKPALKISAPSTAGRSAALCRSKDLFDVLWETNSRHEMEGAGPHARHKCYARFSVYNEAIASDLNTPGNSL